MADITNYAWFALMLLAFLFIGSYGSATKEGSSNKPLYAVKSIFFGARNIAVRTVDYVRDVTMEFLFVAGIATMGILWFVLPLLSLDPFAWLYTIVAFVSGVRAIGAIEVAPGLLIGAFFGIFAIFYMVKWIIFELPEDDA